MTLRTLQSVRDVPCGRSSWLLRQGLLSLCVLGLVPGGLFAQRDCTVTSWAAWIACQHEIEDDRWIKVGNCRNLSDAAERLECFAEAREEYFEAHKLCRAQRRARRDVCDVIGEAPYDPQIDPEDFVDFESVLEGEEDFTSSPYLRLIPGTSREYLLTETDGTVAERVLVEVLAETREIAGVSCIVVRDRVWEFDDEGEEELVEDTADWLAQHKTTGDVWYFGESVKDFEDGLIVSVEGSFEHGTDFAKAGFWVLANPVPGTLYRQEFHLGEAEDIGEVISVGQETVTVPAGTFADGVLKTRDSTPLEPDALEFKYYAPGVGLILEEDAESGDRLELIEANDP